MRFLLRFCGNGAYVEPGSAHDDIHLLAGLRQDEKVSKPRRLTVGIGESCLADAIRIHGVNTHRGSPGDSCCQYAIDDDVIH